MEQRTPEWHEARRKSIGGSDIPVLFGAGFKSPTDLWMEKMGFVQPNEEMNADMRRGVVFEPIALAMFVELTGTPVTTHGFVKSQVCEWMHHSPDGITANNELVEIKVPRPNSTAMILAEDGDYTLAHYLQCQHGMAVCGCDKAYLVLLNVLAGEIKLVTIQRDKYVGDLIEATVRKFWTEHVVANEPPHQWEKPALTITLRKSPVEVGDGPVGLLADYDQACGMVKTAEERKEAVKAQLEAWWEEHGDVGEVKADGLICKRYHVPGRETLNSKLLLVEHPEIDQNRYMTRALGYHVMRVTKDKEAGL